MPYDRREVGARVEGERRRKVKVDPRTNMSERKRRINLDLAKADREKRNGTTKKKGRSRRMESEDAQKRGGERRGGDEVKLDQGLAPRYRRRACCEAREGRRQEQPESRDKASKVLVLESQGWSQVGPSLRRQWLQAANGPPCRMVPARKGQGRPTGCRHPGHRNLTSLALAKCHHDANDPRRRL